MSWDVVMMRLPAGTTQLAELPDDFETPLGSLPRVLDVLRETFPDIDLSDPTWGTIEGDDYSIEFNIGDDDPCTSIMLHVRGTEQAIEPIRRLCDHTGWAAFDTTTDKVMDFAADPADGLRQWRAFRDQVLPGAPEKGVRITIDGAASSRAPRARPWWQFWK